MSNGPRLELIVGGAPENGAPLRELYQKYGATVLGRCRYILRDPNRAEDAMQDVFAKAIETWDGFRAESSPLTWLVRIATNHCLNVLRAERAGWHGRYRDEALARGEGTGGPRVFEVRDFVQRMLGKLDAETQAAVIHYHVDEMTLEEVAAALERSVPTVRKRLEAFALLCRKEQLA